MALRRFARTVKISRLDFLRHAHCVAAEGPIHSHLRRILKAYAAYYNQVRPHLSLAKDAPLHRPIQRIGSVFGKPILRGLHYVYCRT